MVGRGVRSYHGEYPELEARNVQLVLRRIAVLNSRDREAARVLVDECYAANFVANVKCKWYRSSGRDGLIRAFDEAFAAGSVILEPRFHENVTAERVEFSYSGIYNGATFDGFCSASFTPDGKFLSESWRVVK